MGSGKTIAISQSNYIPWKGYFDIIASVDEFVVLDTVQYNRRSWRNRNKIIVNGQVQWLTIPVNTKGRYDAMANTIEVTDGTWASKHWATLKSAYGRAEFFNEYSAVLQPLYGEASVLSKLTDINTLFMEALSELMGLATTFVSSDDIPRNVSEPTERLVEICQARQAARYVTGPAATGYLSPEAFERAGVELLHANYDGYPVYSQGDAFLEHSVSMIDVLFRCGADAHNHLKSMRDQTDFLISPPMDNYWLQADNF